MDGYLQLGGDAWQSALRAAKSGQVVELGRIFETGMPHYPTHPDFEVSLARRHGDRVRADGGSSASCHWSFGGHTGTHIDALCHISHCGKLFDGTAVDNAALARGDGPGDASELAPHVRRGVLFDVPERDGVDCLAGERVVSRADLEEICVTKGFTVERGDVALIRTGWGRYWGQAEYIDRVTPGPDLEAAQWLVDRGVSLVGSDTAVFEKGPIADAAPVHRLLLMEHRIHIMENLDLDDMSRTGASTFLFLALPLRVRGGTASPLRPIAIC